MHTFLAVDPANSSSLVFLGQKIKANVRITTSKNIPTTAFLNEEERITMFYFDLFLSRVWQNYYFSLTFYKQIYTVKKMNNNSIRV